MSEEILTEIIDRSALRHKQRVFPGQVGMEVVDSDGRLVDDADTQSGERATLTGHYKTNRGITTLDTASVVAMGSDMTLIQYFMVVGEGKRIPTNIGHRIEYDVAMFYNVDKQAHWPRGPGENF